MPVCDCGCDCRHGCPYCDRGCTSREATPIDPADYDGWL